MKKIDKTGKEIFQKRILAALQKFLNHDIPSIVSPAPLLLFKMRICAFSRSSESSEVSVNQRIDIGVAEFVNNKGHDPSAIILRRPCFVRMEGSQDGKNLPRSILQP